MRIILIFCFVSNLFLVHILGYQKYQHVHYRCINKSIYFCSSFFYFIYISTVTYLIYVLFQKFNAFATLKIGYLH